MAERELSLDLKKLLVNNEPFAYAHLVKYERPSAALPDGSFSTDAKRYAYYTDAAHNINFNDSSLDTDGNANGTQTYIANKILNVGTYSETVEAKASGMTITLAAESLHNSVTSNAITMTSTTITVPAHIDLADEGFREGDKILISGGSNNNQEVRITGIKTNNTVLTVANIDSTLGTQSSGTSITLKIISEELKGPLQQIGHTESLKAYHNREVFVYKAFLDPDTSAIKGTPVLIFKGIIQGTDLNENPQGQLTVNWSLTSHWGDFAQVKGRISNDKIHRAVDAQNRGQPEAALKPEYANDLGFMHSEQTTNILATYTAIEQEMRIKVKKSWGGFKTKVKTWMEDVEVQREVNLDFSLNAHFIPVIYGIDRVQGKPIFVDTKSNDPNNIFIAYSLCEGQIGGLYDLYIDGNPLICINKEDSDDRNDSTGASKENVQVFCRGRQDLGNTLGGIKMSGHGVTGSTRATYQPKRSMRGYGNTGYEPMEDSIDINDIEYNTINKSLLSVTATDANGGGVLHEESITLSQPNTMSLTLHTGKPDQKANDTLTSIAVSPKFKRQQDYFDAADSGAEYWSPNHRLLDTAYVVLDCEIADDATTVPEIEYVVRGKLIDCYNYDYSYDHAGTGGESHTNFNVGDQVTLKRTSDNSTLNANVTIIDKWSFADESGVLRYRFRYSDAPDLNYSDGIPGITAFYHTDGTNNWHMVTYNHIIESGTVPATLSVSTTVTANNNSALTAATGGNPNWLTSDEPFKPGGLFNFFVFENETLTYAFKPIPFALSGTTLTATGSNATGATGGTQTVVAADKIKLATSANNSTDGFYNDYKIELTKTVTISGVKSAQKVVRTIGDYQAAERVATVTETWPEGMFPDPDDVMQESGAVYTYRLLPKFSTDDRRVSINPAIQLLDYMTAKTYGKGLDIDKDIALSDFLLSARTCDDRGTQTLAGAKTASVGERYVLTSDGTTSGSVVAMGRVKSVGDFSDTNGTDHTVMEECFGKFSKRFMRNTHSYSVGDIVHGTAGGYYRVTSAGTKSTAPTGTNPTGFTGPLTSIPLYKISGGTISSTTFNVGLNTDFGYQNYVTEYNPATKGYDTGYSIYDADNIQYWRYLGWDSPHQRNVTRHQTVGTVDTSKSVFENINGFLLNFNGLLSYEAGQYALRVETTSTAITSQIATSSDTGYTVGAEKNARYLNEADLIGTLSIKDAGPKKAFNTIQASIEDPGNQFKATAVSFYDSNYLRADKNVIKSGNMSQPAVSNYFNARINAENYLRKSRFGMSISFRMGPKALLLLPGETIALDYPKFWDTPKKFRVTNINFNKDCTASITASEYDDSFYTITAPSLPSVSGNDQRQGLQASPGVPSGLTATAGAIGTIALAWTNNTTFTDNMFTEVWVNTSNSTGSRTLLTKTDGATAVFTHAVGEDNATRYYWIRHGKRVVLNSGGQNKIKTLYSNFVTGSPVTNATTIIPASFYGVTLSSNFGAFKFSADGNTQTPTSVTITADKQNLTGTSTTFTATNSSGASVTLTGSGNTRALSNTNFGTTDFVTVTVTVTTTSAERTAGANNTYTDTVTIQKIQDGLVGSNGANAKTVKLTANDYSIVYNAAGASPDPSSTITLTATAQGFTNPYFKFTGDGISDEASFTDGASATNDTFTFSVPSSHFTTPKSLRVGVSEANQTEVAFDTISLFAVKPGQQGTDGAEPVTKEFAVTVSGGKFVINGTSQKELTLLRGFTYKFDQSASTNSNHPIRFSTTSNGTHAGGSAYTSGVTNTGTPGSSGAFTTFKVPSDAPATLYYYCANHSGMGGEINTQDLGSGITVICTNESHAVPADNGGGNPVMTGSGTSFEVFRGNTQLTGITSGTPGADQFKVTVTSDTNITVGSQSASSQAIVFADHSSMTATTANIVYSINVENTQTFTKKQSFSRADKGNTGSTGLKIKELELYYTLDFTSTSNNSYSAITSGPSTGTYTFNNDTLASIPTGWTRTKPTFGAGIFTYISTALATESSSGSNTSGSLTWSTPGSHFTGANVQNFIFKRATSAETPSATNYPAVPSGWYDDIANVPSGSNPIWTSVGTGGIPALSGSTWTSIITWQKSTQLEGTDGTSVTVTGTSTDGNGNTVVTFSDGSTATISKGSDGQTQGVKVAYASDANGTNKSFTQGSLTFVKYVEYTGTAPAITNSVFNSGYVQFIGGDGTSEGVKPIYANNSSGSGASFTQGSRTFVNFYEWTGTEPTSIPSGLTYVKYIGDDGSDGAASQTVFYRKSGASRWTPPSAPSGNITATSIANQWGTTFVAPDTANVVWQSIGNKPSGGSFTWGAPTIFFDKDRIVDLFEDNYSWDFSSDNLGFLGLNNNDFANNQITLPTFTTGTAVPNNNTTPSPNPAASQYTRTGVTPNELYISNGTSWVLQDVNTNTQNAQPTFTSSTSAPSNSTTPSPNPKGSSWLHTTPDPSVLYISNGSTWTALDVNKDTVFDGAYGSLTGTPTIPVNIDDLADIPANPGTGKFLKWSGTAFQWADDNNTVYTLPDNVITGAAVSGQTITLTKNNGTTVALTNTDTNTQLSTADVRGKFSGTGVNTSTGVITNTTYANLGALDSTANTKLSGIATGATNNGSSINSSGNIAGDISMGSKMTFDVSADHIIITD